MDSSAAIRSRIEYTSIFSWSRHRLVPIDSANLRTRQLLVESFGCKNCRMGDWSMPWAPIWYASAFNPINLHGNSTATSWFWHSEASYPWRPKEFRRSASPSTVSYIHDDPKYLRRQKGFREVPTWRVPTDCRNSFLGKEKKLHEAPNVAVWAENAAGFGAARTWRMAWLKHWLNDCCKVCQISSGLQQAQAFGTKPFLPIHQGNQIE